MSEINPLTKDQLFEKKIAENTGSDYNVGDIFDVVPVTKDQSFLKEIALNSAGQSEAIEATQDMISDAYDPTATYAVGDYCIYNDTLYRCNTAIVTGEAFTPAKWTATNVGDELNRGSVSVVADGVKTYSQLFNELFALTDTSKISRFSRLAFDDSYFRLEVVTSSDFFFTRSFALTSQVYFGTVDFKTSGSAYLGWEITTSGNNVTNYTDTVLTNGDVITLYY